MERREHTPFEKELLVFLAERFDGVADVEITDDHTLYVGLSGSCADCPIREISCTEDMTSAIKEAYPQITRVVTRAHVSEDLLDFARKILKSGQ